MTFPAMLEKYTLKIGQNVTGGEVVRDLRELEMEVPVCVTCSYRALAKELIDSTDIVSVVRCKDCKYFVLDYVDKLEGVPLILAHEICTFCASNPIKVAQDHYCGWGERREE